MSQPCRDVYNKKEEVEYSRGETISESAAQQQESVNDYDARYSSSTGCSPAINCPESDIK